MHNTGLILQITSPQRCRRNGATLGQQLADIQLALNPTLHTNDHHVAILGKSRDVAIQVLRTDDVQNDISTTLQLLGEILLPIVNRNISANIPAQLKLLLGTCGHRNI